jgi:RNA polymerase sigma-70 factor (ECF subfamily)
MRTALLPSPCRPRSLSDAQLLASARSQPEHFAIFYRRHVDSISGYLLRRVGRVDVAADLTAEVFASALEGADLFDPSRAGGTAEAWLFTIARNTLVSSLRRGRVADEARRRLGLLTPLYVSDEEARRSTDGPDLQLFLEELPAEQRRAVLARVVEERSYDDIANELRCSPLVVRKRVSRGLARLRTRIKETQ